MCSVRDRRNLFCNLISSGRAYSCVAFAVGSGEINNRLKDAKATLTKVEAHFADTAKEVDHTDGVSMSFDNWRFNLRASNTEPVVRLNVESRADVSLMQEKRDYILALMSEEE